MRGEYPDDFRKTQVVKNKLGSLSVYGHNLDPLTGSFYQSLAIIPRTNGQPRKGIEFQSLILSTSLIEKTDPNEAEIFSQNEKHDTDDNKLKYKGLLR